MKYISNEHTMTANYFAKVFEIMHRKSIAALILVMISALLAACTQQQADGPTITVYKSPDCGCCAKWATYMRKHNFNVVVRNVSNTSFIKSKYYIPAELQTCHTAVVGDYLVEGHVPADAITRMLSEKPDAKGLAVPGMPPNSPGMGSSFFKTFDVLLFDARGHTIVYQRG